jgi:hypothetical protein
MWNLDLKYMYVYIYIHTCIHTQLHIYFMYTCYIYVIVGLFGGLRGREKEDDGVNNIEVHCVCV